MGKVVKAIHDSSVESTPKNPIYLHLSKEAMLVYKEAHDRVVSFREDMKRDDHTSVVCKSLGLLLRLAGTINRLREGCMKVLNAEYTMEYIVTEADISMAKKLVEYSVESSCVCVGNEVKVATTNLKKMGIPQPENMTTEFLSRHVRHVENILKHDELPMSKISANNMYPTIDKMKGVDAAKRFVHDLVRLGMGEIRERKNEGKGQGKSLVFKRFHPYDESIPNEKRKKANTVWEQLRLNIPLIEMTNDKENLKKLPLNANENIDDSQILDDMMRNK